MRLEYHAFASWTVLSSTKRIGTTTELRGGEWYEGVILEVPELATRFSDSQGLQRAADVSLVISDGPDGSYRASVLANELEGLPVLLTLVMRTVPADGSAPVEITSAQTLTVVGTALAPGRVTLKLVDLEEEKLKALYPANLWQAADWPDLTDRDAGRPVCFPVGTALKLPAPQIRLDETNSEWWFGLCEGAAKTYAITSVNPGAKRFFTAEDLTGLVQPGQVLIVTGSTAADGRYTVLFTSPGSVRVVETVVSSTGGVLRFMPHPLTIYRSGRVVDAAEYLIHQLYDPGEVANGDFASGGTAWTTWYWTPGSGFTQIQPGTSTITFGAGGATITCATANDWAFIQQYGTSAGTFAGIKGGRYAVQVKIAAGATDAVLTGEGPPVMKYRLPAGKTTTVILECGVTGASSSFGIGVWGNVGVVTVESVRFVSLEGVVALFDTEQVDFRGNPYAVESDMLSLESRNAATEIKRLLTHVGLTPDATTFGAAETVAGTEVMLVDCDYGRGRQRRVSAILDDLLVVARGGLSRTATGEYSIWQDVAGSNAATYDESLGDPITVEDFSRDGRPKSVSLKYRPGSRNPDDLQNTIKRTLAAGVLGDESARDLTCLRDHLAADRLLSYRAARANANAVANATVYNEQRTLGDVITITSPQNWAGAKQFKVRAIERVPNANRLELIQYDSAVYTYVPSPDLGADADPGYVPDYSQTPPAAPTALAVTGATINMTRDGTAGISITVQATVPPANWSTIWFAVVHNVTGEIIRQQGTVSVSTASANLGGLRAGEVYQLKCYAVNAFDVEGVIQSTFDATAVGGGAAVTTFTTPGYATLPPDVPSISRAQGTGRLINVNWSAISITNDNLAEYVLERDPGTGTFTELWRGRALSYVDRDVSYAINYTYRVKARDRWGNLSANWRTASAVAPTRNVTGGGSGDIMDTTVQTVNRTATSFHIVLVPIAGGAFMGNTTQAHGMVKEPIAGVVGGNSVLDYVSTIDATDATNITVRSRYFGNGVTTAVAPANPHDHAFAKPGLGVNISVRVQYW